MHGAESIREKNSTVLAAHQRAEGHVERRQTIHRNRCWGKQSWCVYEGVQAGTQGGGDVSIASQTPLQGPRLLVSSIENSDASGTVRPTVALSSHFLRATRNPDISVKFPNCSMPAWHRWMHGMASRMMISWRRCLQPDAKPPDQELCLAQACKVLTTEATWELHSIVNRRHFLGDFFFNHLSQGTQIVIYSDSS